MIVGPNGRVLDRPLREAEGMLVAELDLSEVAANRRFMDPAGHCNGPDVFQLHVDTTERRATSTVDRVNPPDGEIALDIV